MRVGFLQFDPVFGERERNLNRVDTLCKGVKADLIALPELFATGYTFLSHRELKSLAEPAQGGKTFKHMHTLSKKVGCCFAYGFAEYDGNEFYNSAALVAPEGLVGVYRKNHLFFEEKELFAPGNLGFPIFTYRDVRVGMLVCYDWIYPEAMRTLALKGAQIILHCANLVMSYCPDAHKTRALENHVFIVLANRIGNEERNGKKYTFIGQSEIVSPGGEILVRADQETCVRVYEIEPELALDKRMNARNDLFDDRREEIYFK